MKASLLTVTSFLVIAGTALAQEQDPLFYSPSQALRKLYHKLSHGPHKTGVDVRSYEVCPDCGQTHDPDGECLQRIPVDDCVVGKKKGYRTLIRYEYVVVAEVRYRWKTKWITKEIPADCEEAMCITDEAVGPNNIQDWQSCDSCEGKVYYSTTKPDPDTAEIKRIECKPGQTSIKVKYKSCVKEPYTVYRQVRRPIGVKQPCYEDVEVPIRRYVGQRLKKECD